MSSQVSGGQHYDVLVIGSGFGGSVSALRLTEKGYKVGVLEAGARFRDEDFAKTSWDLKKFLFNPAIGAYGIQRIDMVKDCLILAGAGVGGGSLVYANTLYEPLDPFYKDKSWAHITDWKSELAPYYDQAKRMLGVVTNPCETASDREVAKVAEQFGTADSLHATPVGVLFGGEDGRDGGKDVEDPFFGGVGPRRTTCLNCGECMTGCRHNAKNTLVKNYLYLAEQAGAEVHPLTTVTDVRPKVGGGYTVTARWTKAKLSRKSAVKTFTADHVIFAAAALGTQKLLHKLKDEGSLPKVSDRLGVLTRTNSESILGVISEPGADVDYTDGVAITSSWHPDEVTHIEPVRYGKGSNAMSLMQTVLSDGGPGRFQRWAKDYAKMWLKPSNALNLYDVKHWSERVVILLVMQTLDNSITTRRIKLPGGGSIMTSKQGHGGENPTWIPVANEAARQMAENLNGVAGGTVGEPFNIPLTAHFIGGCTIGDSPETGVVDPFHRMYGYDGLHIMDGSTISANLGVNPSLTITAQAERALSFWPNKGEADSRPAQGQAYQRIEAVQPKNPVVPEAAPAALRLPIVGIS
ncbi:GMC family oxidoreductase [Nocardioides sp.]|uniref:GMC family oxidoreductase n=1 Tax=Nocardioides sp. TaxID=35761 RepID=UPI002C4990D0|nr:GMC family oxidoreductase [Nocardioides sp.]HSX66814.1 GMC family oxidoreductase [Nocardioides sp.]